jgi:hypothetical protein
MYTHIHICIDFGTFSQSFLLGSIFFGYLGSEGLIVADSTSI